MTPARIQLRRTPGWRLPPGARSVARPHRFGNPYRVDVHGRDAALWLYRQHLLAGTLPGIRRHAPVTVDDVVADLAGLDLACWCPLDVACHADVLLDLANRSRGVCDPTGGMHPHPGGTTDRPEPGETVTHTQETP